MSITFVPLLDKIKDHPIVYRNEKVVTFAMVDELHQRPKGTSKRNFGKNRHRFSEGKHFWELQARDEFRPELVASGYIGSSASKAYLITERGYLNLIKSFTDDLSWQIQEQLVDCYFRVKGERQPQLDKQGSLEELLGAVGRFADREIAKAQTCTPEHVDKELIRLQKKCEQQAEQINRLKRNNLAQKRFGAGPSKAEKDLGSILYEWLIKKGHFRFTPRIVRQYGPSLLRNKEAITESIESLVERGFLTRLEECEIDGVVCKVAYEMVEREVS